MVEAYSSLDAPRIPTRDVDLPIDVSVNFLNSRRLLAGEWRLDARYYSTDSQRAYALLQETALEVSPLGELVKEMFTRSRFKRVYVKNRLAGVPLLKPSEMLESRPSTENYLRRSLAEGLGLFVDEGWILLTCSGTVGRATVVGDRLRKFAVSHDAIRIVPNDDVPAGYLYAFLQSWIGRALVTKDRYGSTVKHLEPHHLAGIDVPVMQEDQQQYFHNLIVGGAYRLREEANRLLDDADAHLHEDLGLSPFSETDDVEFLSIPTHIREAPFHQTADRRLKAFSMMADHLRDRLDAPYHNPSARSAVNVMTRHSPYSVVRLGDIVDEILVPPRFKRTYVSSEYGVPFMQGAHIAQSQYHDIQYLSRANTMRIERWMLSQGQVLVTCSGTIGRVGMATRKTGGWTATQHILRITASPKLSNPGYVAAFLMTPYGQHQLRSKEYGAVVKELTEADTANIMIPNPPLSVQNDIGDKVVDAFEKLDEAATLEEEAIREFEQSLESMARSEFGQFVGT